MSSQKARRVKRKFGTYTLDGGGKRKRSSLSAADEDVPSQSEAKDTVKSSTDSYALPEVKDGKARHKARLNERTASPSAEAARTLLDLPEEAPASSDLAPNPEDLKVIRKVVCGEENLADSFGKLGVYKFPATKEGKGTQCRVLDGVPSVDTKNLDSSELNVWADAPVARLVCGVNHKPPLPTSRMFTKRDVETLKGIMAHPIAAPQEGRGLTGDKSLSHSLRWVESRHLDEELEIENIILVHDPIHGVTGSSKSEGGPVGSKRRKGAVPRRVPQEQDGVQTSLEDVKKEIGHGHEDYLTTADILSGKEVVALPCRVIPSEHKDCLSVLQGSLSGKAMSSLPPEEKKENETLAEPAITQILKAISYSNSVTHDKQEVVVLFKASR